MRTDLCVRLCIIGDLSAPVLYRVSGKLLSLIVLLLVAVVISIMAAVCDEFSMVTVRTCCGVALSYRLLSVTVPVLQERGKIKYSPYKRSETIGDGAAITNYITPWVV